MPYPALLLDRDGVVNVDHGHAVTHHQFEFMDGIFDLTRHAMDLGYRIVIITNQAGIALGDFSEAEFLRFTDWMIDAFRDRGVDVTGVFHSPYHRDGLVAPFVRDSFWRKPAPGMILEAARRHHLDLHRSVFVGDQPTDMMAAEAAGVGLRILMGRATTKAAHLSVDRLSDVAPRLTGWPTRRQGSRR